MRHAIGYCFPLKSNKVLFDSLPDYSDNSRALSDYLLSREDHKYEVYWAVHELPKNADKRIRFVLKRYSLKYIYHTITAKYIFATHNSNIWANPHRQLSVCLWHGSPLKNIGILQSSNNIGELRQFRYLVSSSKYYIDVFKRCFDCDLKIIVEGFPRNDLLFKNNHSSSLLGINMGDDEKLICYLPTFRKGEVSGNTFDSGIIKLSDENECSKWNQYFKENKIHLLVKPHPADINAPAELRLSNLTVISNELLLKLDMQLNAILSYTDALITDYSSVFCDYLLLNRPIGFLISDLVEYEKGRGFIFDNIGNYLPGKKLMNEDDFMSFCEEIAQGIDNYEDERKKLSYIYNDYIDGDNCKRIVDYLRM